MALEAKCVSNELLVAAINPPVQAHAPARINTGLLPIPMDRGH
jgi:hypothetical protein